MAATRQVGTAKIKLNGTKYPSKPGATMTVGNIERTVEVIDGEVYYTEAESPSVINATFVFRADLDISKIHDAVDQTIEFETDAGKTITLVNAVSTTLPNAQTGGSGVAFVFSGKVQNPA